MTPTDLARRIGEEIGVSPWMTLDQQRIDDFARCTGDDQWIHVDVERAAKESPFGGTVAHGYLTLSLLAPTATSLLGLQLTLKQIVNYGIEKTRFLAPVRAGKRVRNRMKVAGLEDKGDGRFVLAMENTIEIEGGEKPALVATSLAMLMV